MSEAGSLEDWSDEDAEESWYPEEQQKFKKSNFYKKSRKNNNESKSFSVRGIKVDMLCICGTEYQARKADLLRGWALSCSKSCAARGREFGLPSAKILGEK